jgi:quercetin dioxygenase-like cupin family protein
MTKMSFLLIFIILNLTNNTTVKASADLSVYNAPENIHITPIGSSETASEFVIFIRNEVKAHFHKTHTELIYVLEGEGVFRLGETKQIIKPGDFIRINKGLVHSVMVISPKPLKVLSVQTPKFEGNDRTFINN